MNSTIHFVILSSLIYASYADDLIVSTKYGKINGTILKSRLGKDIYSFRGVPYAKAPIGPLRFKAPENPDAWDGVLDATGDKPECPQYDSETSDEDCLYLNVYSPNLSQSDKTREAPKSVMVFFHPGGWYIFSGRSDLFGPQYLLDQDIVLVTCNYRLGALGFLSTGDDVIPGNQGSKDQVWVLRWVRDNIAAFGGDPEKVTIVGYSVGGYSVSMHLVSPMSKGLFKKAIIMSGTSILDFTIQMYPEETFQRQTQYLNCERNSTIEIVECMRQKTFQEIVSSSSGFADWYIEPIIWIGPVVEADRGDGSERFLTEMPVESYINGRFAKDVPVIIGYNLNEIQWRGKKYVSNESLIRDLNNDWKRVFPIFLMYTHNSNKDTISSELRQYYLNNEPVTKDSEKALGMLFSDNTVTFSHHRLSKLLVAISEAPIYIYHFVYQGKYSFAYQDDGVTPYGVCHQDDLMYLFKISVQIEGHIPNFRSADPEIQMVENFTRIISNFIKYGNPTPEDNEVVWTPTTVDDHRYFEINNSTWTMRDGLPDQERMPIWEKLFPLPSLPKYKKHLCQYSQDHSFEINFCRS